MKSNSYSRIVVILIFSGMTLPPVIFWALFLKTPHGVTNALLTIKLTLMEQIVIYASAFVLKPIYEILTLMLIIILWRRTEADLAALRRAMIAFFLGENACTMNFLFFNESSMLLEFLHTYGMVVCFGLVFYALMKFFDMRIFNVLDHKKKCAILPLCKSCYKYNDISCNFRLVFLFVIPATAVIAVMPLTAALGSHFYSGEVFGHKIIFGHPMIKQILEVRLYPLASLVFTTLSFIVLLLKKEEGFESSKILYAIGLGPLCFSMMRFLCYWGYAGNPLWADVWEEMTEFLFITFIFWFILRICAIKIHALPFSRTSARKV